MKTKRRAFFLTLVIAVTLAWPLGAFPETVEIFTFSYPPYMNDDGSGLMEKIFDRVFEKSSIRYTFKVLPRKRAIIVFGQPVTKGLFLGERSYFPNLEGIEYKTLVEFKTVFVYMKSRFPETVFSGVSDLKGKRVGISLGSVLAPYFTEQGLIVDEALLENNIMKLKAGRIDFWHTVDTSANRLIDEKFPGQKGAFAFVPDKTHSVDLVCKKGNDSEAAFLVFCRNFDALSKKGEIRKIVIGFMSKNQPK
jgi:ABC-type amino acid transport substrate-binding protein